MEVTVPHGTYRETALASEKALPKRNNDEAAELSQFDMEITSTLYY